MRNSAAERVRSEDLIALGLKTPEARRLSAEVNRLLGTCSSVECWRRISGGLLSPAHPFPFHQLLHRTVSRPASRRPARGGGSTVETPRPFSSSTKRARQRARDGPPAHFRPGAGFHPGIEPGANPGATGSGIVCRTSLLDRREPLRVLGVDDPASGDPVPDSAGPDPGFDTRCGKREVAARRQTEHRRELF